MKRITGTVSVLGAIFWIIAIIYFSLEVYQTKDTETALEMLGMIVFLLSVLHICFFSKFWKKNKSNTGVSGTDDTSTFNEIRKEELQNTKKAKHKPFKSLATFSNSVSAIALLFSALSIYFQFFNEIHAVSYSSLSPDYDEKSKQITFPVLFKNTGNRTETILDTELQIEKGLPDNHFFKKISSLKSNEAYLILSPGESKKIDLVGNYEDYFSGTIGFTKQEGYKYFPATVFDSIHLKIKITFLTQYGTESFEEREIGKISFNQDQSVKILEFSPVELRELELDKITNISKKSVYPYVHNIPLNIFMKDSTMTLKKLKYLVGELDSSERIKLQIDRIPHKEDSSKRIKWHKR